MAHMMKMTRAVTGHMFNHYGRSDIIDGDNYVPRSNENINPELTGLNYNLAYSDQPQEQLDFLRQRLSEIKVQNRKDVNVMVDWVVTLPQAFDGDEQDFFQEAYRFLNDRYGKENVISAYVHMDETTPHMHYAFVPVVEDKKKGGYKLSAKEAVNRKDLQTFHNDLSKHMERSFGKDIGILNEATKEGNKSIAELKRGAAQEKLRVAQEELQKIAQNASKTLEMLQRDVYMLKSKKRALEDEINALESERKAVFAKYENNKMKISEITSLKPEYDRGLFGGIKGITGISISDIDNLKAMAIKGLNASESLEKLQADYNRVQKLIPTMEERIADGREKAILQEKANAFDKLPEEVREQVLPKKVIVQQKDRKR